MPVKTMARPASFAASITSLIAHRATGLDHAGATGSGCFQQTVGEREERIRCHGGAFRQAFVQTQFGCHTFGLRGSDVGTVQTAHLTGTDAHGGLVFHVDDGIRFDVLGDFPREQQVLHLRVCRVPFSVTTFRSSMPT